MLNPNNQPLTSTSEGLNNLSLPVLATRSTSNPILACEESKTIVNIQAKSANQLTTKLDNSKQENTNISIDNESTYSPDLEHSSFFSRNYNESLIRLLSSGNANNNNNLTNSQPSENRLNSNSVLNNLKSLSGSILNSIQKPFQTNQNPASQTTANQFEPSHTCNLNYRLNTNLNESARTIEPLINNNSNNIQNDSQQPFYYTASRYQQFTNDSPSFSASSSNNFSFNTISTALTNDTMSKNQLKQQLNDCYSNGKSEEVASMQQANASLLNEETSSNQFASPSSNQNKTPGANLLNNNIFKLNLDNLQNGDDEQNVFNMSGNASSLSNKPLTIYEKRYLLAVERGDLAGVRRMIEMAPQIETQEKEKSDYSCPVFNINCTDPIGRSALLMAIDNENLDMIELLVECGVEMRDSLLHAINEEFVEAVELLLDYEEALQCNKKVALESTSLDNNKEDLNELDKSINFSFDLRPTLIQNKENESSKASQKLISQKSASNQSPAQTPNQNTICNKLSVNSTNSNSSNVSSSNKQQQALSNNNLPAQFSICYSWEGFERETFTSDVTPLILAAHKNNYEIIKLLLDRGISKFN